MDHEHKYAIFINKHVYMSVRDDVQLRADLDKGEHCFQNL